MRIGFACPVSLQRLRHLVDNGESLPPGYQFAPSADWIQELMKRGHDVTVYTTATEIDRAITFRGSGISIRIARARASGKGRDFFAFEREQLKHMMMEDRCEIIHAHWTYEFALAALASGIPTLTTIHDLPWNVLRYYRDLYRVTRLLMAYEVAIRGRHFTAVSNDAASHFRHYLKPGASITVIPNGLGDAVFELNNRPNRKLSGIAFATILQGWSRRKNAEAAIKAFRIVRQSEPGSQLLMFGFDYEPGGPAQRWASERGLAEGITFVGALPYQELLQRVSKEADVVLHPSLEESFSMAAIEGMALRKPVIAGSLTPGVREVLGFGKNGVLVDVRKTGAIAKAMQQFVKDVDYRNEVAQSGFDRASSLYRLKAVMSRYEEMYGTILGS